MTTADHDLHTLAGAYALDALSPQERSAFAEHLAACAPCRQEIVELREVTARLGTAAAVLPRPELRAPTIGAAHRTSQLAPVVPERTERAASPPADAPALARRQRAKRGRARRAASGWPRLAAAAAAVAVAGAAALGVAMHDTMRQLHQSQWQQHKIFMVLTASDAVMRTARIGSGGMATVVVSRHERMGVFTAHLLPALPATKSYELWLIGPGGDRPAGMLAAKAGGMAGPAVISGMGAGDMIGLTVEPASGSRRPTSPPLVLIAANSPGN